MNTSKVFLHLSYGTSAESLLRLCKQYGVVNGVRILRDEVGLSRGLAFVDAATPADAVAIIAAIDERVFEGHRIRAEFSRH